MDTIGCKIFIEHEFAHNHIIYSKKYVPRHQTSQSDAPSCRAHVHVASSSENTLGKLEKKNCVDCSKDQETSVPDWSELDFAGI
jgi:hypothetical protein